jgi:hypothetical protein
MKRNKKEKFFKEMHYNEILRKIHGGQYPSTSCMFKGEYNVIERALKGNFITSRYDLDKLKEIGFDI